MIKQSAIVAGTVLGPAAVVGPLMAITPPLQSDPELSGQRATYAVEMKMSGPALAGKRSYDVYCADCHGLTGQGTPAGPRLKVPDGRRMEQKRDFHEAITAPASGAHASFALSNSPVDFNTIERMAKFLREVQRLDSL